jgi:hypothetical protein
MRSSRLLSLTGPLFAVVWLEMTFVMGEDGPGESASGKAVIDYVDDHEGALLFGVFAGPAIAALILVFFSHVRTVARERTPLAGAGPSVMVGGAVVWAGGMLFSSCLELAGVTAADKDLEQVAQTLNVLIEASWLPFIGGIALTLIGAGMTVLRTGIVSRWLGWVALVVGLVALCGPGGLLGFFVGPLWMRVAGIMLYTQQDEAAETAPAGA